MSWSTKEEEHTEKSRNKKISLLGEFTDKETENEYLADSLSSSTKRVSYIALIYGLISMLFLVNDYSAVGNTSSFLIIAYIRVVLTFISVIVFLVGKKINKNTVLIYLTTLYQAIIALSYLLILNQYDSLSYLSILGLMVISLAIFFLPNRIIFSLIISGTLSTLFFLYPMQKIEDIKKTDVHKILAYHIILLIYCMIKSYFTESYERKQFAAGRELLALSVLDPLTGIYNRAKFNDDLEKWVNYSKRYGNPLSIILFDIDNFKSINDRFGHLVGDNITKNVVNLTKNSIRNTDIFARWGGDEFVIILPNTNLQEAQEMAERMRICIRNNLNGPVKSISCSFGVAALKNDNDETANSLFLKADDFLFQAKAGGKDRVVSNKSD
ncbi:MAG: GGDEF domain-containing protein [Acetivibrionales bacterium]|jgi:two-component system cell cycle response regulator